MNTNSFQNCCKCFDNLGISFKIVEDSGKINMIVFCKKCKCVWFNGIVNPDDFEFER